MHARARGCKTKNVIQQKRKVGRETGILRMQKSRHINAKGFTSSSTANPCTQETTGPYVITAKGRVYMPHERCNAFRKTAATDAFPQYYIRRITRVKHQ